MLNLLQLISQSAFASTFMPTAGSAVAAQVDSLYKFLLIVSGISCVLVIGGLIYFALKYKRTSESDKTPYITHNNFLEFLWSFIPFVLFMIIFAWGWDIYHQMRVFPENALELHVYGKKWNWDFAYKSGRKINSTSGVPVLPVDTPIKLIMTSKDVIHSFFIPGMRVKQDVLPGRYTAVGFTATKEGEYHVFCTEFCGNEHSKMLSKIKIVSKKEYEEWLANDPTAGLSMAQVGEKNFAQCLACHSATATKNPGNLGPPLGGIFGQTRTFESGDTGTVDDEYLRESIMNANAKVVKGYPRGVMPAFGFDTETVTGLIEYIKTLK